MKEDITARSYTLRIEGGQWLGQVVLTSDGMFASVTDWGNFSFAWRSISDEDVREFICRLSVDYFATKMYTGMAYIVSGQKIEKACQRFAEHILPALQKALQSELKAETDNQNTLKQS